MNIFKKKHTEYSETVDLLPGSSQEIKVTLFLYHWWIERGYKGKTVRCLVRFRSEDEKIEKEMKEEFPALEEAVNFVKRYI